MMNCIFCSIIDGTIPAYKVYEDDNVIAILDISQATKGHTLVITKKHFKNIYELDSTLAADVFKVIPKISKAVQKAFSPIGLNILINTDEPLQSVHHFHIHIIPRYKEDKVVIGFENNQNSTTSEMYKDTQQRIIQNL